MMNVKKPKILEIIDLFEDYILPILMCFLIITIWLGIVYRWLPFSFYWTVELASTLFGYIIWFGLSAAIRMNTHTKVDIVFNLLNQNSKNKIKILHKILFICFLSIIGYYSLKLNIYYLTKGVETEALGISMFWLRIPITIGCLLGLIRLLISFFYLPPKNNLL